MKVIGFICFLALSTAAEPAFLDYNLNWIFPQQLGGMDYEKAEAYGNLDLGYSVFYGKETAFKAVVSVYNMGHSNLPDGHQSEPVNIVSESVEGLLKLDQKKERISGLKKRGTTVVPKQGAVQFASTVFQYKEAQTNGVQKIRAVYVTCLKNNFIKVQFTFDRLEGKKAQTMATKMIDQLIQLTKEEADEQTLLLASCAAFLHDPLGHGGRTAAGYFLPRVQTMDNLNVYTHLFAWPNNYLKPKNVKFLIAAYFAGMLPVVVPEQLEEGGEFEAFIAMLNTYELLRSQEQIDKISKLDEWVKNPDKQALFDQLLIED